MSLAHSTPSFICPMCQANLTDWVKSASARFKCQCDAEYGYGDGVYRFVPDDAYLKTFSFEWNKYSHVYDTEEERAATERTLRNLHITPESVDGRLVLDVGCGTGRFSKVLCDWGARVVAVDLSQAIYVAQKNIGDRKSVTFAHADLFRLPFPAKQFDVILAWGVLHHTPDTEAAFKAVARHLKPGGRFSVYIYGQSKGTRRRMRNLYRNVTPKLSMKLLYSICLLAAPMYYVYKIPLIGNIMQILLPMSRQKHYRLRILETFDEYAPKYAWRHTFPQVHQWFVDAGMKDNAIYDPPIRATGVLPVDHG
jgi:ubiquinone/menaquinone biosynthesis C-methylase UbiE